MSLKRWIQSKTAKANDLVRDMMHSKPVREGVESRIKKQLGSHVDGKDRPLGYTDKNGRFRTEYSYATELITGGLKQAGEPFNLNYTGRFWNSIEAIPTDLSLRITADTQKSNADLKKKFGEEIIHLSDENKGDLARNEALKELKKVTRQGIGL